MAKELTEDVLRTVANFLILACGKTTTLDIRKNLEVLGYEADKEEVSKMMDEYYEEGQDELVDFDAGDQDVILTFEEVVFNGKEFRMYSFIGIGDHGAFKNWCYECEYPVDECICDELEQQELDREFEESLNDAACECFGNCGASKNNPFTVGVKLNKLKV